MNITMIRFSGTFEGKRSTFTRYNMDRDEVNHELKLLGVKKRSFISSQEISDIPFAVDYIKNGKVIRRIVYGNNAENAVKNIELSESEIIDINAIDNSFNTNKKTIY
jgi:hypothetical protein